MEQVKNKRVVIKNKKRFYTIIIILATLVTAGVVYGVSYYNKLKNPQGLFSPEDEDMDINAQFDKNIINILLVGFDKNESRSKTSSLFRTDTNIVATINLEKQSVSMLSIPRDSFVPIAHRGGNKDKFNAAYGYGYRFGEGDNREENGFKYLMDTASDLLGGAPIHYYVAVDMDVVVEIVDAIGGVEMEVPKDLYKKHGRDRSKIVVEKGYQKLDGYKLLYFARYRHLLRGDIDRVENQQKILMATFDSLKRSNKFTALPKIYQSLKRNIKTNLELNQIAALGLFGTNIEREDINIHTMPGDFGSLNSLSYWIIDQEKRVELIKELFGITIAADQQDPTEDKLTTLELSIPSKILNIGEGGEITAKGITGLGYEKLFDPGDLKYKSSNSDIVSVSDVGIVRALSPGHVTITVSIGGVSRQINISVNKPKDVVPPVIKLNGGETITLNYGEKYTETATAIDDVDGDITSMMKISGLEKLDTTKPGTYILTYNVKDKAGNEAKTVKRIIEVKPGEPEKPNPPNPPVQPEEPEEPIEPEEPEGPEEKESGKPKE